MATLLPAALSDPPVKPIRNLSYVPKPPPPTPAVGPTASPLELGALGLSNEASTSLPNITEATNFHSNDLITTHIINQTTGRPAAGLRATLTCPDPGNGHSSKQSPAIFSGMTDSHGRISDWYTDGTALSALLDEHAHADSGTKKIWILQLESEDYWQIVGKETMLPEVVIKFYIDAAAEKAPHHIPVLLAQWGYTVYRGN